MQKVMQHVYSFSVLDFVPKILRGEKPHTIRPRRKRKAQPGDLLTLYYKQRTKESRVICLTVCKRVLPMVIYPFESLVSVNGHLLDECRTATLARKDGFIEYLDFFAFFERYKQPTLYMELVEWDPNHMLALWEVDTFQELVRPMSAVERLEWLNTSVEIGKALENSHNVSKIWSMPRDKDVKGLEANLLIIDDPLIDEPVDKKVIDEWYKKSINVEGSDGQH